MRGFGESWIPPVLLATCAACSVLPPASEVAPRSPARERTGWVWVYLIEAASPGDPLETAVGSVVAVDAEGGRHPLTLRNRRLRREPARDTLLAEGPVPVGDHVRLEIGLSSASLGRGHEEAALLVAEDPVPVPAGFTIRRGGAVVLHVRFDPAASVVSGYRLEPALAAGVAPEPALGLLAVAACRGEGALFFYDKMSGRTFDVLPVGEAPSSVILDSERRLAFVALSGEDAVAVVAVDEREVLERIPLGAGDRPEEIVAVAGGRTLLSANAGSASVSFVDTESLIELDRVGVGDRPRALRVEPGGQRVWVANSLSDTVSAIDVDRRTVVATISVDPEPYRLAFDRTGDRLYVIHRSTPYLTVLDPANASLVRRVWAGIGARAVTVDPVTGRILLARDGTGFIDVYDPDSLLPADQIAIGGTVRWMVVDRQANVLHAVLEDADRIELVRPVIGDVYAAAVVGRDPVRLAVAGER